MIFPFNETMQNDPLNLCVYMLFHLECVCKQNALIKQTNLVNKPDYGSMTLNTQH